MEEEPASLLDVFFLNFPETTLIIRYVYEVLAPAPAPEETMNLDVGVDVELMVSLLK